MKFTAYVQSAPRGGGNITAVSFEHPDKGSLITLVNAALTALPPAFKFAGMQTIICLTDGTRWSPLLCKWVPHRSPHAPARAS